MKDGKRTKEWLKFRKEWIKLNPPNHQNYYLCGICAKPVKADEVELDHIDNRDGSKLTDMNNIQPSHSICNRRKGSRRWKPKVSREEYKLIKELDL